MNPQLQQQRSAQPQEDQQVPPSSPPPYSVAHLCPCCGAEIRPDESFCLNCGARLTPVSQPPMQHPHVEAGTQQAATLCSLLAVDGACATFPPKQGLTKRPACDDLLLRLLTHLEQEINAISTKRSLCPHLE